VADLNCQDEVACNFIPSNLVESYRYII